MNFKRQNVYLCIVIVVQICFVYFCEALQGPDPWDRQGNDMPYNVYDDKNIPPDLRIYPKNERKKSSDSNYGIGEWFYRRILGIILKGGQVKKNEDESVDITLQMKLNGKEWHTLDEYLKSSSALSEDKLRRSLGYIEQSIYEPSIPTKIILTWSDYIQTFLSKNKPEIAWSLGLLAIGLLLYWIKIHMSHRNALMFIFLGLYAYEVFVSYKEAEQKEVDTFVAALNSCKWQFWSSNCELPKPDPLVFLKHMNPTKIGVRMFTTIVSEPMIEISGTVKTMCNGITDGLWYPFNIILAGILTTVFNFFLVIFLIMILFNFILNIPFNFGILGSLINVGLPQRRRSIVTENNNHQHGQSNNNLRLKHVNTLSGHTLDKFIDVVSSALSNPRNVRNQSQLAVQDVRQSEKASNSNNTGLKRSASTGRLPNTNNVETLDLQQFRKRNNIRRLDGSGDAF